MLRTNFLIILFFCASSTLYGASTNPEHKLSIQDVVVRKTISISSDFGPMWPHHPIIACKVFTNKNGTTKLDMYRGFVQGLPRHEGRLAQLAAAIEADLTQYNPNKFSTLQHLQRACNKLGYQSFAHTFRINIFFHSLTAQSYVNSSFDHTITIAPCMVPALQAAGSKGTPRIELLACIATAGQGSDLRAIYLEVDPVKLALFAAQMLGLDKPLPIIDTSLQYNNSIKHNPTTAVAAQSNQAWPSLPAHQGSAGQSSRDLSNPTPTQRWMPRDDNIRVSGPSGRASISTTLPSLTEHELLGDSLLQAMDQE